eukprot:5146260-Prorocentrum_lima.AAC.1
MELQTSPYRSTCCAKCWLKPSSPLPDRSKPCFGSLTPNPSMEMKLERQMNTERVSSHRVLGVQDADGNDMSDTWE